MYFFFIIYFRKKASYESNRSYGNDTNEVYITVFTDKGGTFNGLSINVLTQGVVSRGGVVPQIEKIAYNDP